MYVKSTFQSVLAALALCLALPAHAQERIGGSQGPLEIPSDAGARTNPQRPNAVAASRPLGYLATNVVVTTTPYVELGSAAGRIRMPNNNDDDYSGAQPIGFNFKFRGKNYSNFVMNTNGFIILGDNPASVPNLFFDGPQAYTNGALYSTAPQDSNMLAVFNVDLTDSDSGLADYRVRTTGTAPNRVCTIQWKNVKDKAGQQLSRAAFQIKLYENTNFIEYVYGRFVASTQPAAFRSAGVGLRGRDEADVLYATKYSGNFWSRTAFVTPDDADPQSTNQHNYRNSFLPDAGVTYRFTTTLQNNVGVAAVLNLPGPACNQGIVDSVGVVVANTGSAAQTNVPVNLRIDRNTLRTGTIPRLDSGKRDTIYFNGIDFSTPGNYSVTTYTALTTDQLPGNDTLRPDSVQNIIPRAADGVLNTFEDERSTAGWVAYNLNNDGLRWTIGQDGTRARSGIRFLYLANSGTIGSNDWLVSGCYGLVGRHRYKLRFAMTNVNNPATSGTAKIRVYALRQQGPDTTGSRLIWEDLAFDRYSAQGYMDTTVSFFATDTASYYIGWQVFSAPNTNILLLDDVSLDSDTGLLPVAVHKSVQAGYRVVPNPSGPHGFSVEGLSQSTPAILVDALGRRRELMLRKEEGYRVAGGLAPGIYSLQVGTRVLRLAIE